MTKNFEFTDETHGFLKETAKWTYFLSILGFIGIGFMVILALFVGTIFSKLGALSGGGAPFAGIGTGFITVLYLILALIYFFPVYYLFQFSSKTKNAFKNNDNELLNESFKYLKSHFKYIGVIALIFISLYSFVILLAVFAAIFK
ncbi:hypothetical protein [Flavobacterium sp. K5-23]|uniref:hypothetical protein n=1 Tax=Flavobacterium sp. K5-23 TaxID=2746225 RepID=UPI0020106FE6|nr:hypothetical protein [Flavobacterium sp. K5-23]